jgi:hypothetical protein
MSPCYGSLYAYSKQAVKYSLLLGFWTLSIPEFYKQENTTFRKLDLFPSSGNISVFNESWSREFSECLETFDKIYDSSFGNSELKYCASLSGATSGGILTIKLIY